MSALVGAAAWYLAAGGIVTPEFWSGLDSPERVALITARRRLRLEEAEEGAAILRGGVPAACLLSEGLVGPERDAALAEALLAELGRR